MKRLIVLASVVAACASIGACSTAQQATATADLAKLQATVVNGCMVVQPTLVSVAALDPTVSAVATAKGLFCAVAGSITVTSIQSLVSTGIPAIEKAVTDSTLVPSNQKPLVIAALGLFQMTVSNALEVYGNAAAAAPASAPVAASQ